MEEDDGGDEMDIEERRVMTIWFIEGVVEDVIDGHYTEVKTYLVMGLVLALGPEVVMGQEKGKRKGKRDKELALLLLDQLCGGFFFRADLTALVANIHGMRLIVETLQGAPVKYVTELGAHHEESFESMVGEIQTEIYHEVVMTRLGQRQIIGRGRVNMLFRDRHGRAILALGGVISLRITVHHQMSRDHRASFTSQRIVGWHEGSERCGSVRFFVRDRTQEAVEEMRELRETIPLQGLVTTLQGQVTALQGQVMTLQGQALCPKGSCSLQWLLKQRKIEASRARNGLPIAMVSGPRPAQTKLARDNVVLLNSLNCKPLDFLQKAMRESFDSLDGLRKMEKVCGSAFQQIAQQLASQIRFTCTSAR
ncbi:hypothetical protein Tco_0795423 [Tanacetum coccineum]